MPLLVQRIAKDTSQITAVTIKHKKLETYFTTPHKKFQVSAIVAIPFANRAGAHAHKCETFSKEERKDPSRNQRCQKVGFEPATLGSVVQRSSHSAIQLQLLNRRKIFAIYAPTLLMYIVAGPDPNPRGGVNYLTLTREILR